MGVAVSAAFARHRISRIPLIGVPLATLCATVRACVASPSAVCTMGR